MSSADLMEQANFKAWANEADGLRAAILQQGNLTEEERQALMTSRLPIQEVEGRRLQASNRCQAGYFYYDSWGLCQQCGEGCSECTSRSNCTTCDDPSQIHMFGACRCDETASSCGTSGRQTCSPGTYHNAYWNECQSCSWNCSDCDNYVNCNACASGFTLNSANECVTTRKQCPAGKTPDYWGNCACPQGTHDSGAGCVVCYANQQWDPQTNRCRDKTVQCPDGQYLDYWTDACSSCYANCHSCDGGWGECNKCEDSSYEMNMYDCSCPAGQVDDGSGCRDRPREDIVCGDGSYLSSSTRQCETCSSGCAECTDGTGECRVCKDGYDLTRGYCKCPLGFKDTGAGCEEMPAPPTPAPPATPATPTCPAGQYLDGSNSCQLCGSGCASCNDQTGQCNSCSDSTFSIDYMDCQCNGQNGARTGGCNTKCPAGQFMSNHHGKCQDCGQDCASCDDGWGYCNKCTHPSFELLRKNFNCQCPWGYEHSKDGKTCEAKTECPRGQYRDFFTGNCEGCGANCKACNDKWGQCTECKDSTYENHYFTCACPRGFMDKGMGCVNNCPDGYYHDHHAGICQKCAKNCKKCDDLWGFCTECDDDSFCMNKRTCSCLEGFVEKNDKCVLETKRADCPLNYDIDSKGKCCACKPGTTFASSQPEGDKCTCSFAGSTINKDTLTCECLQEGAFYAPNTKDCMCHTAKGAIWEVAGEICVKIDSRATEKTGTRSDGTTGPLGEFECPTHWMINANTGECVCNAGGAYFNGTDPDDSTKKNLCCKKVTGAKDDCKDTGAFTP